jgi:phosphoglycolate phosphatase-like HAD superfamily hydrolase
MNKLILFDIDGTLISGAHGHVEAFAIAFKEVYGVDASIYMINPNGMTDQQIIIETLMKCGLDKETVLSKINECMRSMIDYFKSIQPKLNVKIFPGVPEILYKLDKEDAIIGLVTGNLEPIARAKMEIAGLNEYFVVGGFGSDAIDRSELVKKAIKQAKEKFNFDSSEDVFLVGDTPLDVSAALKGGAKPIGVATGSFDKGELADAGASRILATLENIDEFIDLLD